MSLYQTIEKPVKAVEITKDLSVGLFADGTIMTMIHGKPFVQCRKLILAARNEGEIAERLGEFENMDDFIASRTSRERDLDFSIEIDPETELFGHASSIQAWAERGYNIDLIDTMIAFPILMELSKHDPDARRAMFFEVERRCNEGSKKSREALSLNRVAKLVIDAIDFNRKWIESPSEQWISRVSNKMNRSVDLAANPFIDKVKRIAVLLKSGIVSMLKYYASQYEKYPDAYYGRNTRLLEDISLADWMSEQEIAKMLLNRYKEVDGRSVLDALEVTKHRGENYSWVDLLVLMSLYPGEETMDYYGIVDQSAVKVYSETRDARVKQEIMSEEYSAIVIMDFIGAGAPISELSGESVENFIDTLFFGITRDGLKSYTVEAEIFKVHAAELKERADPIKFIGIDRAIRISEDGKK